MSRWARLLTHSYTRLALKPTNGFIAYGAVERDYLIQLGAPSEKIHIAHNAIDTDQNFANLTHHVQEGDRLRRDLKLEGKKNILSVGTLLPQKGVDILIRAYVRVRSRSPNIALVIVGDGPHREELEEIVEDLSVGDVTFVGRIEGSNPYFAMADLFVLPGLGGLALHQAVIVTEGVQKGAGEHRMATAATIHHRLQTTRHQRRPARRNPNTLSDYAQPPRRNSPNPPTTPRGGRERRR